MSKAPAYQMYASDWLGSRSVRFMDDYQRGWYIQLLNEAWDSDPQCMLPDNDELLQKLAGISEHSRTIPDFNDRWLVVRRMFKRHGEYVANDRQMEEFAKQEMRRKQASAAGRSSAAKRAEEAKAIINQHIDAATTVERPLNDRCDSVQRKFNPPIPTPTPVPSPVSNTLSRRAAVASLDGFSAFWQAYPRKTGKGAAEKAWAKVPRSAHRAIMDAIEKQKGGPDWMKDGGQFIPHPATWLNQRRWEDEVLDFAAMDIERRAADLRSMNL